MLVNIWLTSVFAWGLVRVLPCTVLTIISTYKLLTCANAGFWRAICRADNSQVGLDTHLHNSSKYEGRAQPQMEMMVRADACEHCLFWSNNLQLHKDGVIIEHTDVVMYKKVPGRVCSWWFSEQEHNGCFRLLHIWAAKTFSAVNQQNLS